MRADSLDVVAQLVQNVSQLPPSIEQSFPKLVSSPLAEVNV